jgi:pimeloyl-ACP methyl ester carboxylesterase
VTATMDVHVEPGPTDQFATARFSCHMAVPKPRAVVVLTPGSQGDGRYLVTDSFWVKFAETHKLALVGCYFTDKVFKVDEDYVNMQSGSGNALLKALTLFNLEDLPLFLWGHSAGGEFNYEFACAYPEKVKAFIVNKGGVYYTALAPKRTRAIPALFFVGGQDARFRRSILMGIYDMNYAVTMSQDGAFNWELRYAEREGHEQGASALDASKLFAQVLEKEVV